MRWGTRKVSDLCVLVADCPHSTPRWTDEGVRVLRSKNIRNGTLDLDAQTSFTSEHEYEKRTRRAVPQCGDLVITREAPMGEICMLPDIKCCLGQRMVLLRPDESEVDPYFLLYAFQSHAVQGQIKRSEGTGTTVSNLRIPHLEALDIPFPSLEQQQSIAVVLKSYEDLIENNRRRIQLLEESARLLYKEWFVHLRFPGHEHVKIANSVPEGWRPSTIKELANVYRGKSYKSSELREQGGRDFVNLKCIQRYGGFRSSGLKRFEGEHKDHHRLNAGDIVMAVTDMTRDAMIVAQAGRVPRSIGERAIYSMDLVKIVPREGIEPSWLYLLFRHSDFSFAVREHATGTNVLHLKPKYIEEWSTPIPPVALRRAFADIANPILDQIDVLEMQSAAAAQARDLLLPRLMNGEVAV